jgi:hypothetical protein
VEQFGMADGARFAADQVRHQQVNALLLGDLVMMRLGFGFATRHTARIQEVLPQFYLHRRVILVYRAKEPLFDAAMPRLRKTYSGHVSILA